MPDYENQSVQIEGMHCDACVRRVTAALAGIPGVRVHHVEVGRADVLAKPSTHHALKTAIEQTGFTVLRMHGSN